MLQFLKNLLGLGPNVDYKELLENGAQIIDVRTKAEYQQGHIKGSRNIPLDKLANQSSKLKKEIPIITCCASGMRSAQGKRVLTSQGFSEVHNGGGWQSLNNKIR